MKIFRRTILSLIVAFLLQINLYSAEENSAAEDKNPEVLMGVAIQRYLEGDLRNTITNLNDVLIQQPENARAVSLMRKAVKRLAEETGVNKNYDLNMPFLDMGIRYVGDAPDIRSLVESLKNSQKGAGSAVKKAESAEKKAKPQAVKPPVHKNVVVSGVSSKKINQINSYLRKIENNLKTATDKDDDINIKFSDLEKTMLDINKRILNIDEKNRKHSINFWVIILLSFLTILALVLLFLSVKSDNLNLIKNIVRERKAVEEMKVSYNKDTAELAKKLTVYGKSQQRAGELEKNWEKIINILSKLTEGGSTHKVVIKDSSDGRKAVTGVDPRTRARADSVEVISEIFKDSPKAPEMLLPFLDDEDNRTRANAAVAYYRYDPEKAVTVIREMAQHKDKWMRLSAAWALGQLADTATSTILESLLDDPDSQVKNKARVSLEKILGNPEV